MAQNPSKPELGMTKESSDGQQEALQVPPPTVVGTEELSVVNTTAVGA
jgi:hypothetical protein